MYTESTGHATAPHAIATRQPPRICLGFETAALYWRAVRENRLPPPTPLAITHLDDSFTTSYRALSHIDLAPLGVNLNPYGVSTLYRCEQSNSCTEPNHREMHLVADGLSISPGVTIPLHLMVGARSNRRTCRAVSPHVATGTLPPHSLHRVTEQIVVVSPELTLAQLSRKLRVLPCIELICEWCGWYAFGAIAQECTFSSFPLTDLSKTQDFLAHPRAPKGADTARQALMHAIEGLASPRETEAFLMLTLPEDVGGYALPKPYANQQIPLKGTPFAALADRPYYVADLLWPRERVIVEYDGFGDHEATPQQVAQDKERRSVLAALGYTVIVITKRDTASLTAFEQKVRQVALALARELPHPSASTLAARNTLFSWLFDPAHDHLPFGFGYR